MFKLQGVEPLNSTTLVDSVGALMEPGTIVAVPYSEWDSTTQRDRKLQLGVISKVKYATVDVAIVPHDRSNTTVLIRQFYPDNLMNVGDVILHDPHLTTHVRNCTDPVVDSRWPQAAQGGRRFMVVTVNDEEEKVSRYSYNMVSKPRGKGVDRVMVMEVFGTSAVARQDAILNIKQQGWFLSGGVMLDYVSTRNAMLMYNKHWYNSGRITLKDQMHSMKTLSSYGLEDYVNHVMSFDEFNQIISAHKPNMTIKEDEPYST